MILENIRYKKFYALFDFGIKNINGVTPPPEALNMSYRII